MESKSNARVGFALLCGLAVCCSVMYLTADGAETILASSVDAPRSIESTDVKKAGVIYTKTPTTLRKGNDGRQRLLTYFDSIEESIAKEVESRKSDVSSIRATMAKDQELNAAARTKMKSSLMLKMAANAKIAKDDLADAMRRTQAEFARTAALENQRHKMDITRFRKTRALMRANKREATADLAAATGAQQRALSALDSATNAKIKSTNKHIAANSAQMDTNAKKARKDLDAAMASFDNTMRNAVAHAKSENSKLAEQAAAQDKSFRQYATSKVQEVTAQVAEQFSSVRTKMAKDRAHADKELAAESSRFSAALNAQSALENEHFAKTVSDIAAAKVEAATRVEKFTTGFKVSIAHLAATASEQNKKLNNRRTELEGTVKSNKLEQAVVDNEVDKEIKRMVELGNKRYAEHLQKDEELNALMSKNKDANTKRMDNFLDSFMASITAIKQQAAKDRAHHEREVATSTTALFSTLEANVIAQAAVNKQLTDATHAMKVNAARDLKTAKDDFSEKVAKLTTTVAKNAANVHDEMNRLTGIEEENNIKNARGRAELRKISDSNRLAMKEAVRDAVHKGEQRAIGIDNKMAAKNKQTKKVLGARITAEIGALTKSIHNQVAELALESKEARALMKKEILAAITEASTLAKNNLKAQIEVMEGKFSALDAKLAAEENKSSTERAALTKTVADDKAYAMLQLNNAVAAQARTLMAFQQETEASIKDTDTRLDAQAGIMAKNAKAVKAQMKANSAAIDASLDSARKAAVSQLEAVSAVSAARYNTVIKSVTDGIKAATAAADAKFADLYAKMAKERTKNAGDLAGARTDFNDKLAKFSALSQSNFEKTVTDLDAAKAAAKQEVALAHTNMIANIAAVRANIKASETRVLGDLQVVSSQVMEDRTAQARINKHVTEEMARIESKSDEHNTANVAARGVIRNIMNQNKATAAAEVAALSKRANADIAKARGQQAALLKTFKKDLTHATDGLYAKLSADESAQSSAMSALNKNLGEQKAATAASLKSAKAVFASKVTTLTNAISANQESFKRGIDKAAGLKDDWKANSAADRAAVRKVRDAMVDTLKKDIVRAIQKGEADRKAVEELANANIRQGKKALLETISESVENMADNVFVTVQGNRQKIADNYLSLKAYAATAADKIQDYLAKGKGRNLSSVGDLLESIGALSKVKVKAAAGESLGASTITTPFSGKEVKVDNAISKINGLVNEYIGVVQNVKNRWPLGLGKYLISKLEVAMQGTGALEVDKVADKSGNFVFMNAHAVGLSSRLGDFQTLAVRMSHYERNLAGQTAALPKSKKAATQIAIPPPQWQGN